MMIHGLFTDEEKARRKHRREQQTKPPAKAGGLVVDAHALDEMLARVTRMQDGDRLGDQLIRESLRRARVESDAEARAQWLEVARRTREVRRARRAEMAALIKKGAPLFKAMAAHYRRNPGRLIRMIDAIAEGRDGWRRINPFMVASVVIRAKQWADRAS